MGGTYSESEVYILLFRPDAERVADHAERMKQVCISKGIDFNGPSPQPRITIDPAHTAFNDFAEEGELFGQEPSRKEKEVIPGANVARRVLRIFNGDDAVREVLSIDPPDQVFLRVDIQQRTHGKGGVPATFTYNPTDDYANEI